MTVTSRRKADQGQNISPVSCEATLVWSLSVRNAIYNWHWTDLGQALVK